MITINQYAVQDWAITPVEKPSGTTEQDWLMVLTGVAVVNLAGSHTNNWHNETLLIAPAVEAPIAYALEKFSAPRKFPLQTKELGSHDFFVEQGAPFAVIGSVFDKETSGSAVGGFKVNTWRLHTIGDSAPHRYAGIEVDVAIFNQTMLYCVNYQITLVGKIVYIPPPAKLGQPDPGLIP